MPTSFPDNVFFERERLSGLIDFYFACTDFLAYDLAICLNAWCFEPDGSFNVTKARHFVAQYHAVRPLRPDELDALPILARGAAMRFLLTRLYDWLNTPKDALVTPKDPYEYLQKLRFHRGARGHGLTVWTACVRTEFDGDFDRDVHRRRLSGQSRAGEVGAPFSAGAVTRRNCPAASLDRRGQLHPVVGGHRLAAGELLLVPRQRRTTPQPPGPGLPRQAPSVNSSTAVARSQLSDRMTPSRP